MKTLQKYRPKSFKENLQIHPRLPRVEAFRFTPSITPGTSR